MFPGSHDNGRLDYGQGEVLGRLVEELLRQSLGEGVGVRMTAYQSLGHLRIVQLKSIQNGQKEVNLANQQF